MAMLSQTAVAAPSCPSVTAVLPEPARLTIAEYERIVGSGVFDGPEPRRIELLEGVLSTMSPINYAHALLIDELAEWAILSFPKPRFRCRVQNPIELRTQGSVPQPDLALVAREGWSGRHPGPEQTHLVVEVADSSLELDLTLKRDLYAAAGIADYWVIDIPARSLHVHRDPHQGAYRSVVVLSGADTVRPLAHPEAGLELAGLFALLEPEAGKPTGS